jgi:hypothetical protein
LTKTKSGGGTRSLEKIRLGLSFPSIAVASLRGGKAAGYQKLQSKFLEHFSHLKMENLQILLDETARKKDLVLPKKLQIFEKNVDMLNLTLLYYLVRIYKPKIAVETGVWSGKTSWSILQAMADNGEGKLFSIDLGVKQWGADVLPTSEIGGFVPQSLRPRWQLIIGDSKEKVPTLLTKLKTIDLFYHDSNSSDRDLVNLEFAEAIRHLSMNGILCSDDVYDECNTFKDVSGSLRNPVIVRNKVGYAFK